MERASLSVEFKAVLTELHEARLDLAREAEGFKNFAAEDVSPDTKATLRGYEATWRHMIDRIDAVVNAITDLEATDYPNMPPVVLSPGAYNEIFSRAEENNAAEVLLQQAPPVTLPQPRTIGVS
jgi:hypothetical protein